MTPDDHDLLAVYALDAIDDPAERARVEALVATDPEARRELRRWHEITALLTPEEALPPGAWDVVRAEVEPELPPLDVTRLRPDRRPSRAPLLVAAGIVIVLVAIGGLALGISMRDDSGQVAGPSGGSNYGPLDAPNENLDPEVMDELVLLVDDTDTVAAEVRVRFEGESSFVPAALPALPAGRTYQLWALAGDADDPTMISVGVLGADPEASRFHAPPGAFGYALSVEDDPGAVTPSVPPVALGTI